MLFHVVCHLDTEVEADSFDEACEIANEIADGEMDVHEVEDND